MKSESNDFEKLYEELRNGVGEKTNFIGVFTPAHPGNPFLYFLVTPDNKVTGTSKDWEAVEVNYKREGLPRSSVCMVYYLDVPKEIASNLLQHDFIPTDIRREIVQYKWGKIGCLKTNYLTGKVTFVPGSASKGPIRGGKSYIENSEI